MDVTVEDMRVEDWKTIRAIYQEGIATGHATFETDIPEWAEWDASHFATCRLVARIGGQVAGWAALSAISSRCVYGDVAEVSVYVAEASRGRGVGRRLLQALVEASEGEGIWTLQAGIFPENEGSIALHKTCGFRSIGRREGLGQLHGVWRDVVLMERRSKVVGV